jgi:hypothetical protein
MTYLVGAAELRIWTTEGWLRVRGVLEDMTIDSRYTPCTRPVPCDDPGAHDPKRVTKATIRGASWKRDRSGRPVENA